jgi:hypothetical protein
MRKLIAAALLLASSAALAQDSGGPSYAPDGKLAFPADYREWIYLSTDFDLSYAESAPPNTHVFGNVFVNREAYAAFRKTRTWPDKTMLVLELRAAGADNPFNKRGQYQSAGAPAGLELHVKDQAKGGWNFYAFGRDRAPAAALAKTASCFACHQEHGVIDTTFTQFYPTLADPAAK